MKRTIILVIFLFVGCAYNSGVVPIGKDSFMVTKQAASGFTGLNTLKAEAIQEANSFCQTKGKQFQIVSTTDSQPPYVFGNFPRTEIQFMCLLDDDPDFNRPKLKKSADTTIEINQNK